jgi:hypothetical protein
VRLNGGAPFILNGSATNYPGYLLSSTGMTLYAAMRGTTLYVATSSPGTNGLNDHFVLVSDQILASPTTGAPWAKIGTIAIPANKVMLTGESQGTYVGWQNINGSSATASNQAIKAPSIAGQMQGTIDLVQTFGAMPSTLYLCALKYTTADGGTLVAQAPGPVVSNGNVEASEFLAMPIAAIADNNGDGVLDRLDPTLGFLIQGIQPTTGGFTITWATVPGKTYQVMSSDSIDGGWSDLGAPITAGSGQTTLTYADTTASGQRFYKVMLVTP